MIKITFDQDKIFSVKIVPTILIDNKTTFIDRKKTEFIGRKKPKINKTKPKTKQTVTCLVSCVQISNGL